MTVLRRTALLGIGLCVALVACSGQAVPSVASEGCRVSVGDVADLLDQEQAANAAIIVGESIRRGLPPRAATIGLVTAMQESKLRNLDHGDQDSVGLFQQRPSQGWGTVEQIMDPWYASAAFYAALVKVPDWASGDINDVAQAVQRSGVPEGYRQHESVARAWASALTGYDPAAVSCVDRSTQPAGPEQLTNFLTTVWPNLTLTVQQNTITVTVTDPATAWAVAQLSLMRGAQAGLVSARVGNQQHTIDSQQYQPWSGDAGGDETQVVLQLRSS